ncbi:nuclear export factor GLE1 [Blastococcus sp. TF02-09]|uniref:YcnI family copper-binding membrane protein n=1 Tax=Blastococcus sp. TF02-09 TaxID=2250576 RepID=UPI000DEB1B51|nr:YcnI family protein [Blastococcus sp. TF02-9]RBY74686.1 nuclear export factor GLE1 [Blastococcus sp. TF02-9]
MSTSRARSRAAVVLATTTAALAASVVVASTASAHVTVSSTDAAPGGFGKITFRVPNESDTASTVALRIQVPEESALAFLQVQKVPGWTVSVTNSELSEPVESFGEEITSYVSVVEYRADAGAGIAPGEFQEFALSGGAFPDDADQLTFPTVQTYSDGTESAWIEPTVDGQPEPERPAPVLSLTGSASDGDSAASAGTATAAEVEDDGPSGVAVTALVLAVLGLLAGLGGLALGLAARRRTVAP